MQQLRHRGVDWIGLYFDYDVAIKDHLMQLEGMHWSRTHGCFYIRDHRDQVKALMQHCRGQVWLDMSRLASGSAQERQQMKAAKEPQGADRMQPAKVKRPGRNQHYDRPVSAAVKEKVRAMQAWMEQKRYSRSTITSYAGFIHQFFSVHPSLPWDGLTQDIIVRYNHAQFIEKGRSYSAQNQWINAIKLYLKVHTLNVGELEDIERPRRAYTLPNVLSKEEVAGIIRHTANLKHRTLLMLIYSAGLRIGEALRLKIDDIRKEEGLIYVSRSKGNKDRRVPLSPVMLRALRAYYNAYTPAKWLFEGQKGGAYSPRSAAQVLKRSVARAGIRTRVTLHTLRHSYATHLTQRGVNIQYLQEILGHNSPKTTMLYTHLSGKDIKDIQSPLDELEI